MLSKVQTTLAAIASTVFLAHSAHAEERTLNLSTGADGGNSDFSGQTLRTTTPTLKINTITTQGSWDNLEKLKSGECDAAIVQEDAVISYTKTNNLPLTPLADLYPESIHLICGKESGVEELSDLRSTKKSVALGKPGSGAWVTWKNIVETNKGYETVVTKTETGKLAASQVEQGLTDCYLAVSGLKSATLMDIDANYGQATNLVDVDASKLTQSVGMGNKPLYARVSIEEGTYPKWTPSAMFSSNAVDTIQVMAKVVANPEKISDEDMGRLITGIQNARPAIWKKVGYTPN